MCPPSSRFSSHCMCFLEISIALHTALESLKRRSSFIDNGGDLFSSTRLQIAFRSHTIKMSLDTIFLAPTLLATAVTRKSGEVSTLEACRRGKTRHEDVSQSPTKRRRISIPKRTEHKSSVPCRTYPMTEMQLSLVQSSLRNTILNVIVYFETHPTEAIPALKYAWNTVLGAEPLFNTISEVDETGGYFLEREEMQIDWREMLMEDEESYRNYLNCAPSESPTLGIRFEVVTFKLPQRVSQSTIIWRVHHTFVNGTSLSLIRNKVDRILSGRNITPGPSFGRFAEKLQDLQIKRHEAAVAFWKQQKIHHPLPSTTLLLAPPPPPPPNAPSLDRYTIATLDFHFDIEELTAHCIR
jgi:hypothetical protein